MEGLTEGRIVHYVMPSHEHRPAIVVRVWRVPDSKGPEPILKVPENGMCNLVVFVDGTNDVKKSTDAYTIDPSPVLTIWETSRQYSEDPQPFTWHWIEKA